MSSRPTPVPLSSLRMGRLIYIHLTDAYRCITPSVIGNVIKELEAADPDLLDGYEDMTEVRDMPDTVTLTP